MERADPFVSSPRPRGPLEGEAPPRVSHALLASVLAVLSLLLPIRVVGQARFCVEDADDVLWIDCEEVVVGIAREKRVLCRRDRNAALIPVEPARRLERGEGRCPSAESRSARLDKDGIPRDRDDDAPSTADD